MTVLAVSKNVSRDGWYS